MCDNLTEHYSNIMSIINGDSLSTRLSIVDPALNNLIL